MKLNEFNELVKTGALGENPEVSLFLHYSADRANKILSKLNNNYHSQKEIRDLFSKLINKEVPESFRLFPPFYSEFGLNIEVGNNVFINSCCMFQDQGGIFIEDDAQIGHGVTMVTLNHDHNPKKRKLLYPKPIYIGKGAWVGSGAIILPGISIGKGAIVGAGAVVTKSVADNQTVVGNPAHLI